MSLHSTRRQLVTIHTGARLTFTHRSPTILRHTAVTSACKKIRFALKSRPLSSFFFFFISRCSQHWKFPINSSRYIHRIAYEASKSQAISQHRVTARILCFFSLIPKEINSTSRQRERRAREQKRSRDISASCRHGGIQYRARIQQWIGRETMERKQ